MRKTTMVSFRGCSVSLPTIAVKIGVTATLDQLAVGDSAIVIDVRESAEAREHLAARGISPGTVVRVLKGGDPLLVAIEETRWAIGQRSARAATGGAPTGTCGGCGGCEAGRTARPASCSAVAARDRDQMEVQDQ